jgi:hypothetical protein
MLASDGIGGFRSSLLAIGAAMRDRPPRLVIAFSFFVHPTNAS